MSHVPSHSPSAPTPIARGISGLFQAVLWLALLLAAVVFGHLHRYGTFDLLVVVSTLLAFWVVASLVVSPLLYVRSPVNLLAWGLAGLVLLQFLPLPLAGRWAPAPSLGPSEAVLVAAQEGHGSLAVARTLGIGRYSLRPVATVGVFMLAASAACLYWLVASSLAGRKKVRRATWAVALGLTVLAAYVDLAALAPARQEEAGIFRPPGPILVLGGDSLVPAMLAALPLVLAAALRLLGGTLRRRPSRRHARWGWLARAASVWGFIGLAMVGLVAAAIGMSNVPWRLALACVLLAGGFVLVGFATTGPTRRMRRRATWLAVGALVWVLAALVAGFLVGPEHQAAGAADASLEALAAALAGWRAAFGVGAGAVSPGEVFGAAGWPGAPGLDVDTSGYTLVRAELGWVGWVLLLAGAVAAVVFLARAWYRCRSPWPRTMMRVGVGAVAANLLYFRFDASALLAPNLLALAAVLGIVTAWAAHGAAWRGRARAAAGGPPGGGLSAGDASPALPGRAHATAAWACRPPRFAAAHWPFVLGAMGLLAAFSTAEADMISGERGPDVSDKVLHFGAFAVLNLLVCYALAPAPAGRWPALRVIAATLLVSGMTVAVEYAQRYFTAGRSFEVADMAAGILGAAATGAWWYAVRRSHACEDWPEADALPAAGDSEPRP